MNNVNHSRRWIALAFLLPLAFAIAAESEAADAVPAFVSRNGITWDTTVGQMLEAEGFGEESEVDTASAGTITSYWFTDAQTGGENEDISYYFIKDRLAITCTRYMADSAYGFEARKDQIALQYGEPTETDTDKACEMINFIAGDYFHPDNMVEYCGWLLADGTRAYLFNLQGGICLFHFNEARMQSVK